MRQKVAHTKNGNLDMRCSVNKQPKPQQLQQNTFQNVQRNPPPFSLFNNNNFYKKPF